MAQVLVLDDIGAEQHSPWVRDDVLQVILQYRMQENLPTFFTSNLSFDDLSGISPLASLAMKPGRPNGLWSAFAI